MSETIHIGVGRRTVAAAAAFFGLFTVIGVSRGWNAHSTTAVVIVAVACGVPFAYYARETLRRGPVLVLDSNAMELVQSRRVIRWGDVADLYARRSQGVFGEHHQLVLVVRAPSPGDDRPPRSVADGRMDETIEFSLDQLSLAWEPIVSLVGERLGRDVPVRRERG
ncbi:MAG: hypothetical protein QOF76_1659 [Solirubrobacteraceae bacterium]|jgi:hypothetical protein|nr:hypothetical protein [Solirubrobacteraceae bacterium]